MFTELLREDENVFSVEVTPGWWADKIITPAGQVGMNGQKCAFRSVLELAYIDGTTQTLGTDTTQWKAGIAGPDPLMLPFSMERTTMPHSDGFRYA